MDAYKSHVRIFLAELQKYIMVAHVGWLYLISTVFSYLETNACVKCWTHIFKAAYSLNVVLHRLEEYPWLPLGYLPSNVHNRKTMSIYIRTFENG